MPQNVIEKTLYADMLNQVIFGSRNLYPFVEIMGKVNIPGANYRYDGERSIVLTSIHSGKDVPSNLQTYTANATQQWNNTQETLTVRYSRTYRDFIDKEYIVTGKPLNTAVNIMAAYEQTERPNTISSQYAENLYAIAKANSTLNNDVVNSAASAKAVFDELNEARLENTNAKAILYCTGVFKKYLKDYIATQRRWSNDGRISYDVDVIDDVEIKVVPAKWLKSKYTKTLGYVPANDAVQMNCILVTIPTIISPFILDDIYMDSPTALSDGKAFIASKYAFDLFVHPEAKTFGVYVNAVAESET